MTFPEDYQEKSLAGKPAVFKCTINEVKESQKPELDDEFAKDVSEFDTLDEMKADLEKTMKESKAQRVKNALQEKLMDKVIEKMDGEIPQAMVESQLDRIEDDFGYRLAIQEKLEATAEELEAEFKKLADNNKMDVDKIKELLSEAELKADLACQKASDLIMNSAVLKKAKKPRKTTKKADKAEKTEEAAPAEDKAEDKAE